MIVTYSFVSYDEFPSLYSVLFGADILNGWFSFAMFGAAINFFAVRKHTEFTWDSPLEVLGDFSSLFSGAISVGLVFGFLSSLLFKHARVLTHKAGVEMVMLFCIAFVTYNASGFIGFSGGIALMTCGLVMARYAWYNLSP